MSALPKPSLQPPLEALRFMEPLRTVAPFTSAAWAFLLPVGGHRFLAEFGAGHIRLHSRLHADATRWFPEVAEALQAHAGGRMVVDGEVCVPDGSGRNDVRLLHERALRPQRGEPGREAVFIMNDLLLHAGEDVRSLPWCERRALLRGLSPQGPTLQLGRSVDAEGEWLYRQAVALGRSGIHARRRDAPYVEGRHPGWLSVPCTAPAVPRWA